MPYCELDMAGITIGAAISEKREAILRIAAKHGATQVLLHAAKTVPTAMSICS